MKKQHVSPFLAGIEQFSLEVLIGDTDVVSLRRLHRPASPVEVAGSTQLGAERRRGRRSHRRVPGCGAAGAKPGGEKGGSGGGWMRIRMDVSTKPCLQEDPM